jgi:hypothetical protein
MEENWERLERELRENEKELEEYGRELGDN